MRKVICFPGQRVILASGQTATVAFVNYGQVWVFGPNGLPMAATVCGEAWGGEHDMEVVNAA